MSWSKTATGSPTEVANAIRDAIYESATVEPASPRRLRIAKLVADQVGTIITESEHEEREIVVASGGHLNDDGSLASLSLNITFIEGASSSPEIPADESAFDGKERRAEDQLTAGDHALVEGKLPRKDRRV